MTHQYKDWNKFSSAKNPVTNPNSNKEYEDDGNVPATTLAAIDAIEAAGTSNSNEQKSGVTNMLNKAKETVSNAVDTVKDKAEDLSKEIEISITDKNVVRNSFMLFGATLLGSLAGSILYGLIDKDK